MVAKIFPKTITCVKAKAPVKTDGDIDEGLEAYTDVDTIKNVKLWHWSIPRLTPFLMYRPRVLPTVRKATREKALHNKKHAGRFDDRGAISFCG